MRVSTATMRSEDSEVKMNLAPEPVSKPTVRQIMLQILQEDGMKLQMAGFTLFIFNVVLAGGQSNRSLWLLTMAPFLALVAANCFRDRYVGPKPVFTEKPEQALNQAEMIACLAENEVVLQTARRRVARFNRFQLIWGSVYAGGESLVAVHAVLAQNGGSVLAEALALCVVLGISFSVSRWMFRRESARISLLSNVA